ncbi:MAG: FKBP-type peptidyl-prolyl cis-trans isomerase [Candidatus Micrarchaeota archaeon]|nr:FKBP-type peptidyl-prolyl cis-trans isomerase [Candidatus Micrarchaeota archaeon]
MQKIKKGSKVVLDYVGKLEDGTIFDRSGSEHFSFVIGNGEVLNGFEKNIIGMQSGQTKTFELEPEQAYGPYLEELKIRMPIEKLPPDTMVGSILIISDNKGNEAPATVLEITSKDALLDLNHPLAGKKLIFEVKIISVV